MIKTADTISVIKKKATHPTYKFGTIHIIIPLFSFIFLFSLIIFLLYQGSHLVLPAGNNIHALRFIGGETIIHGSQLTCQPDEATPNMTSCHMNLDGQQLRLSVTPAYAPWGPANQCTGKWGGLDIYCYRAHASGGELPYVVEITNIEARYAVDNNAFQYHDWRLFMVRYNISENQTMVIAAGVLATLAIFSIQLIPNRLSMYVSSQPLTQTLNHWVVYLSICLSLPTMFLFGMVLSNGNYSEERLTGNLILALLGMGICYLIGRVIWQLSTTQKVLADRWQVIELKAWLSWTLFCLSNLAIIVIFILFNFFD